MRRYPAARGTDSSGGGAPGTPPKTGDGRRRRSFQAARRPSSAWRPPRVSPPVGLRQWNLSIELIREIVAAHGWPRISLVGEDGAGAAWLVVQHMDMDLEFQQRCLSLMQQAFLDGDVRPRDLAYLTDRVLTHQRTRTASTETVRRSDFRPGASRSRNARRTTRKAMAGARPTRSRAWRRAGSRRWAGARLPPALRSRRRGRWRGAPPEPPHREIRFPPRRR